MIQIRLDFILQMESNEALIFDIYSIYISKLRTDNLKKLLLINRAIRDIVIVM